MQLAPLIGVCTDTVLSIGGIRVRVLSEHRDLVTTRDDALTPFLSDAREADVSVTARWTEMPLNVDDGNGAGREEVLFDAAGPWRLLQDGADFLFEFRSAVGDATPYKTAKFNRTFTTGCVQLSRRHFERRSSPTVNPLEYPLDELLMIHLLSLGRGVEIHACGLLDTNGRAHVFAGQSGAGKSTMARLWLQTGGRCPGVTLLSDERLVVRTDGNRITAYGTPWHGDAKLVSPLGGELASVFFLNHAPATTAAHTMRPVAGPLAAAKLLACSFLPFHSAEAIERSISALERITREVPCHDLWFAPDPSVTDLLWRRMG